QDEHEKVLGSALQKAGVSIEWNTELVRFEVADRVRAVLRTEGREASVDVDFLCGCDGIHSTVRQGLGVEFPGGSYQQVFYVAEVRAAGVTANGDSNRCLGERMFSLVFPIPTSGMVRRSASFRKS